MTQTTCGCSRPRRDDVCPFQKVQGTSILAGLMTKHIAEKDVAHYIGMMEIEFSAVRADGAA